MSPHRLGGFRKIALFAAATLTATTLAGPRSAFAQSTEKSTVAEALFREGQRLMSEGKMHEGCDKLQASQSTEPALGTLLNLAVCHEKDGRTATAWTEFADVLAQATKIGDKGRQTYAKTRIAVLEKQLRRLVIELGRAPADCTIVLDRQGIPREAMGVGLPLDPGEHVVEIAANGYKTWKTTLKVPAEPGTERVVVPELEAAPTNTAAPIATATPPPAPILGAGSPLSPGTPPPGDRPPPDGTQPATSHKGSNTFAIVVGAVGVSALGAGGILLLRAQKSGNDSRNECPSGTCGDPTSSDAAATTYDKARNYQTAGLVTGAGGVVLLGASVWMLLASSGSEATARATSPSQVRATSLRFVPRASFGTAGIDLVGAW